MLEDEDEDINQTYDNLSLKYCAGCGARMTKDEEEEFEDRCHQCVWEETSGLIDDNPYSPVDPKE